MAAILTLSIGIGASTAAFSVVHAVLLRPLPYPDPDRLVSLSHTLVAGKALQVEQSDASLLFYERHGQAFSAFGGYRVEAAALGPADGSDAERVPAAHVTGGFFPAMGVSALRGRVFSAADEAAGAPRVVVIGERLWERRFGRDPRILNRVLQVNGAAHEVVGIMPDVLRFPAAETEVWLPLRLDPAKTDSATFDYQAIARLRDGVPLRQAEAELQALLLRLPAEMPGRLTRPAIEQTQMRVLARPLSGVIVGDVGRLLWIVLGAAVFVLAIAATNVANLFLVRGEARRNAVVIEQALGASRTAVVLQFVCEGLLVGALATILGAAVASAGVGLLRSWDDMVDLPRLAEVRVDAIVLAFAGLSAIAATLVASGMSAVRLVSGAMPSSLRWSPSATADRPRHRARQALVVIQVALALVLLVGSGLMARSVVRLRAVQPGFDPGGATSFRVAVPSARYATPDDSVRFYQSAVNELTRLPGVQQAAAVSKLPLDAQGKTDTAVFIEGRPIPPGSMPGIHPVVYATPGYFEAAGIPIYSGRTLTASDPPRVVHEVVVSRALAERYWPNESPVGKRLRIMLNGPWYTVVGQVGNVRDTALDQGADEVLYAPLLPPREDARWAPRDLALVVRANGDPQALTPAVRDIVRRLDPSLPIYRVRLLDALVAQASARREMTLLLIGGASIVALVLGAIGLFGVMSYVMALRTREIAIRLALGARPAAVRRMVALQGLRAAAIGIVAGLFCATILTRSLAALLFEVSPTDPAVLSAGAAVVLLVAAAASWIPTRRTTSIDPASALRAE